MKTLLSPSIMCSNLLNLEKSIDELNDSGFQRIHIDVIDGVFAPSMPLGIETIKDIRKYTDMYLDVHIMSKNNEFFINEMIEAGADRITFHIENQIHSQYLIDLIKSKGIDVGIALAPATDERNLKYIIDQVSSVLVMMINPGYANSSSEGRVSYGLDKIKNVKKMIEDSGSDAIIQIDGRVSLEEFDKYLKMGATDLVLGSRSLFQDGLCIEEARKMIVEKIEEIENEI